MCTPLGNAWAVAALSVSLWLFRPTMAAAAPTAAAARIVASQEPDWPQWRGPRRDGVCTETGLLREWPEGGPRLLWKAEDLGRGYSAPIIVRNRIYLAGEAANTLVLYALDADGKTLWTATNGASWTGPYPGARASCAFSAGRIYHMNAHGRVGCYDADTGKALWAVPVHERFDASNITWARAECLIVDGNRVFATAGGRKALAAALDAKTGETLWASPPLRFTAPGRTEQQVDAGSYGSPLLVEFAGRRLLVNTSQKHVFGVDATTGELLWTYYLPTQYEVIAATPTLIDNAVFITAPDTDLGGLLRLRREDYGGIKVVPVWSTRFDNCHGGVVPVGKELFGGWYRRGKGWAAVDLNTGSTRQALSDLAMGSVLAADGRLYCLAQNGEMALVEPSAGEYQIRGRFRLAPDARNDAWTHPVILNGLLYLRYHEQLFCYDIKGR